MSFEEGHSQGYWDAMEEVKEAIESIPQFRCDTRIHDKEGCPKCQLYKRLGL